MEFYDKTGDVTGREECGRASLSDTERIEAHRS